MNVAVVECARTVPHRISETISHLDDVNVLCEATEIEEVEGHIRKNRIDILITDAPLDSESTKGVLDTLKQKNPTMVTIMLSIEPLSRYHPAWRDLGAEFLLDKTAGLAVLPDLLRWIHRQQEYAVMVVPFASTIDGDWFAKEEEQT